MKLNNLCKGENKVGSEAQMEGRNLGPKISATDGPNGDNCPNCGLFVMVRIKPEWKYWTSVLTTDTSGVEEVKCHEVGEASSPIRGSLVTSPWLDESRPNPKKNHTKEAPPNPDRPIHQINGAFGLSHVIIGPTNLRSKPIQAEEI